MLTPMTTILIFNAVSSLLAGSGIGALWLRERRRARWAAVRPAYVPD